MTANFMSRKIPLILIIVLLFSTILWAQNETRKGKNPIIIIPGIMGSKLKNRETNEIAWVKFSEAKSDNLKLPISPDLAANRDNLEAFDIVDKVKVVKWLPGISVYADLIEYLEKKAGYQRGNWELPLSDGDRDTYYIFAYDWRRDNVESAHLLLQKIEKLKVKLNQPDLKFDVLAHSMGGLITRYAAMYGDADLNSKPNPDWSGAKHFDKIFMLGTPNEGSMEALETLYNGYSINSFAGKLYPEFLSREVGFTIPSLFQLLPHGVSARFYDEDLKPFKLDIYDVKTWKKYGWSLTSDPAFMDTLGKSKKIQAEKYFEVVLLRAKHFHQALNVKTKVPAWLTFYLIGSDCKNTLDGAIVYFDTEKGKWETLMDSSSFKKVRGEKVPEKLVRQTIFTKGDGTVTKTSLFAETIAEINGQNLFTVETPSLNQKVVCEDHTTLSGNKTILQNLAELVAVKSAK
jgi:pimeloyl-ACP methyl ester carboxylesterase